MRLFYGIPGRYKDITDTFIKTNRDSYYIIPKSDVLRSEIFGDPNPGVQKELVMHLNGNITQWLVDSFDRNEDRRDRPAEFAADRGLTAAELLQRLGATLDKAAKVLDRLTTEELLAPYEIQGYKVRGLDAVYQVVEHFAQHYGQVAYITKSLLGKDLGFYRDLTKTGLTSSGGSV